MYMTLLVLDDSNQLDAILERWNAIDVTGVTIVESTGAFRRTHHPLLGARYRFGMPADREPGARGNLTLFAIVPDEATANRCLIEVEAVVGDLNQPNTGVFAAWPLGVVKGLDVDTGADETESGK